MPLEPGVPSPALAGPSSRPEHLLTRRAVLGMLGGLGLSLVGCSTRPDMSTSRPQRGSPKPTAAPPPSTATPSTATLLLGAFVVERTSDPIMTGVARQDSVLAFEQAIGRKLSVMHIYRGWAEPWGDAERWAVAGGRIPFVNWNGTGVWPQISAGHEDPRIDQVAALCASLASPIWVSFHAEPTLAIGTAADYVGAFSRVASRFAEAGVTNVSWALVLKNGNYAPDAATHADTWYAGLENVVDLVGADAFNFAKVHGHCSTPWTLTSSLLVAFQRWAAEKGKPGIIGETATLQDTWTPDPTRRADWYGDVGSFLTGTWPDLKAWVYFAGKPARGWGWDGQTGQDCTGRRNSWFPDFDPDSLAAFRSLAAALR